MPLLSGRVVVSVFIGAPLHQVWGAAADLGSHPRWMADAESIVFEADSRSGLGTRFRVATRIGPFRTTDLLEVTGWEEGRSIGVRHCGLVKGEGRFDLASMAGGTRFSWVEDLAFPWWLGGPVTALVARPILARKWSRNLEGLKRLVEGRSAS